MDTTTTLSSRLLTSLLQRPRNWTSRQLELLKFTRHETSLEETIGPAHLPSDDSPGMFPYSVLSFIGILLTSRENLEFEVFAADFAKFFDFTELRFEEFFNKEFCSQNYFWSILRDIAVIQWTQRWEGLAATMLANLIALTLPSVDAADDKLLVQISSVKYWNLLSLFFNSLKLIHTRTIVPQRKVRFTVPGSCTRARISCAYVLLRVVDGKTRWDVPIAMCSVCTTP
jgi:hypothetical protein